MKSLTLRQLIESGSLKDIKQALETKPGLANQTISWRLNQANESDPLHYVCDCVFNGHIREDRATGIANLLIEHGANIDGREERETPLIAATSLGVEPVAKLLIEHGANLEAKSVFGARALHWAAAVGLPSTVELLIQSGAELEARCSEFDSTPLYWSVVGFGPHGPNKKRDPLAAAKILIAGGASVDTKNNQGVTALECALNAETDEMHNLLITHSGKT